MAELEMIEMTLNIQIYTYTHIYTNIYTRKLSKRTEQKLH